MKTNVLIGIGIAAFLAIVIIMTGISTNNKATALENQASAQQDRSKIIYDGLWKTVKQKGQVADEYESTFKEIYPDLIEGRYGAEKGGALMKLIVESNPDFDTSLLKDLSRFIESSRAEFNYQQGVLRDIKRSHDNLRTMFPSKLFVGGRKELKVTLITSSKTESTYQTGKEDDIDVFSKDK